LQALEPLRLRRWRAAGSGMARPRTPARTPPERGAGPGLRSV